MTQSPSLGIILAAGKGTRMKSAVPKVLHKLAGAPMIAHVLGATQAAASAKRHSWSALAWRTWRKRPSALEPKLQVYVQPEQQGTADAVKAARQAFEDIAGHVLILYGDTPLLRPRLWKPSGRARCRRRPRRHRLRGREPDRLRAPPTRRPRTAGRHPRGEGREAMRSAR